MARIFITGSTDGLGRGAASVLIGEGHDVVLHARTRQRAAALSDLAPDAAGVVIGDLSSAAETRALANQVNDIGQMGAVIHNAGVFPEPSRAATAEGHPKTRLSRTNSWTGWPRSPASRSFNAAVASSQIRGEHLSPGPRPKTPLA